MQIKHINKQLNILVLPSWYPSQDFLIQGIFIQEQLYALSELYPELNIGVGLWGQNQKSTQLWAKDHFKNISKIINFNRQKKRKNISIKKNLAEFHIPTLNWTKHILNGNFKTILKAGESILLEYEKLFGKVDLIHAQVCHQGGLIAYHLGKKFNIPYVITEQMSPFPFATILDKNGTISEPYLQAYQNAHYNIAISPDLQTKMELQDIPNTIFIPNLTDEDFFTLKPSQKVLKEKFHFFTLARMEEQKDIPTLLKAIKLAIKENPNLFFNIGGDGSQLNNYKKLAFELNIEKHIAWLGLVNREQAKKHFHQSDAFVLASVHETLGVVYIEAIACGLPIIATKCGGPECIVNPENGFLVNVKDSKGLAEKILMTAELENKRSSEKIRTDFLNRFSKKIVCKKVFDIYKQVIF